MMKKNTGRTSKAADSTKGRKHTLKRETLKDLKAPGNGVIVKGGGCPHSAST